MVAPTAAPIAKLGHVEIETPDLDESCWFFCDLIGLQEVTRVGNTAYLSGVRDWDHHTLSITETGDSGVNHVGWRASSPEAMEELASTLGAAGVDIHRMDAGTETGIGDAIRFESPHGHPYEVYYDVERPSPSEEKASVLANRRYSPDVTSRVAPQRLSHVHVQGPSGREQTDWHLDTFGMGMNEIYVGEDGREWGWWISSTPLTHDIAVHHDDIEESVFHHVSFHVEHLENLWAAADILREHGIAPDAGPGKHAVTLQDFFYVIDPASGVRLELVKGPGYLNFEPDREPVVWKEGQLGTAADHQWIGDQYSNAATRYSDGFLE